MKIQPYQLKTLHALLSSTGTMQFKREMIRDISGGRTESSRELTYQEAERIIEHLKSLNPTISGAEKMRKKILSFAHEMGWHTLINGEWKIDIKSVDSWCVKYSYLKKRLNDYTYEELPKLVTQFEHGPYKHYLSNL